MDAVRITIEEPSLSETDAYRPRFKWPGPPRAGRRYQFVALFHDLKAEPERWTELQRWLVENDLEACWRRAHERLRTTEFILEVENVDGGLYESFIARFEPVECPWIEYLPPLGR